MLIVSWRIIRFEMIPNHDSIETWNHLQIFKSYNYTQLLPNYFTEGFIHRGIQGSVFYFFRGLGFQLSLILYHLSIALWLCIPLFVLLRRLAQTPGRAWIWLSLVLLLSPQLFMSWARDVGKSDMLVEGFIAWALLACLDRRYILASLIIFTASQVHETGLVYGGSLFLAMGLLDYRAGKLKLDRAAISLGLLGSLWVLALVGQKYLGPTPQEQARDMAAHLKDTSLSSYLGVYMAVGGLRTILSSACFTFRYPGVYFNIASIYFVLAVHGVILPAFSRLRLGLLLLVAALPMTVLTFVAIDFGRWLMLAVLNWWLINAALQLRNIEPLTIERWPPRTSMLAGLAMIAMGSSAGGTASNFTGRIANRLWSSPEPVKWLDQCDPTWRSVAMPPPAPPK